MKNIFRFLMAVAVLFTASCTKEDVSSSIGGGEVELTFTANLADMGTRLYGDGSKANVVYVGVYEAGQKTPLQLVDYTEGYPVTNGKATITVVLLKDKVYDLVFWAQNKAQGCYGRNWEDRSITVNYGGALSQDETRDAFFLVKNGFKAGHDETVFELRRPFAQLRAGISEADYDYVEANGSAGIATSQAVIKGVANVLSLNNETAEVYGDVTATFGVAAVAAGDDEKFTVNGADYYQLSMNYLLVREKTLVDVTYTFADDNTAYTRPYYNVPVQRNYRTNIIGQLISSPMDFTVIIKPEFEGEHTVEVWDGESVAKPDYDESTKTYTVDDPKELAWIAQLVNGTLPAASRADYAPAETLQGVTINITEDLDLGGNEWLPIGGKGKQFKGTLNGNDHIVSNFQVTRQEGYAALIGNLYGGAVKNLTVRGVKIVANHYAGAIVGQGYAKIDNCHAENVEITLTTKNGDWGDKAGAIIGQNCEGGMYVKNSSANNVVIKGYRDLGGIAGMAQYGNTVSGCSVDNLTILQDLSVDYENTTPSTLDAVVGRLGSKNGVSVTLENNTVGENIVISSVVNSAAELQAAVERTNPNISVVLGKDIKGDVTIPQSEGVQITINGNNHNYDGVITVDGKSGTFLTAALTIKDVNFNAESISADACINLGASGNNNTRYTCNVTVDKCTFDVAGAVGVKSYTGGDKNLTISNSTATAKAHSLVQAKGIDGILVEGCKVYSKNGLNFNNSDNVTVEQCEVAVRGYAVRYGESSGGVGAAEKYWIKNSSLSSTGEEGDAVVVLRGTADYATLNIENTTLSGDPQITNNATGAVVIIDGVANVSEGAALQAALQSVSDATINLEAGVNYEAVTVGELKDVTINGAEGSVMIFKTNANTKLENVTLNGVKFEYTGATADCGIVLDANAQIDNLVIDGCTVVGTGAKAGRGLSGYNNNATIVIKNTTFKDLGYPIYAWGGYKALTIENCTFENIKSWAVMPQSGFDGDLTVSGCNFVNCLGGGLVKAGKLTADHTFTFTNNTITGCTIAGDHNWFQFNVSAGTSVISGNTKDGAAWTPGAADGLTL
ncbi:MAG: hypothetical protein E7143_02995 [Rikenellaceae bacterium]|nr:hypothetical protein [Rikenellaceae bacterium]